MDFYFRFGSDSCIGVSVGSMADLSENLLKTIVKKLDKLIECVKELIKILGGKSER